ncbi:hypothetical protein OCL88_20095 [Paenarthrobacter sp. PAE-2]|uniref:hypothetical protein n=1 Tax=Paenarthrobacter sp. PAE-2 TaxID=2982532 RepID=UPI002231611E|nr:hypothetical protein [Paenarthrobacter sp. PAE-2]MCW3768779.1 hypothetical protein [Paenarthrobacter sp. PAE-2]
MSVVPTHRTAPLSMAEAQQLTGSVYISRREAAAYMCVSEKYLATHLHDGPKRLRVGSKVVYRLADIENYMRQMEVL